MTEQTIRPRWSLANIGAVPGTGKHRRGHYFRRPRNAGIKRALISVFGSLRGVSVPPSSYDDIHIKSIRHRTWKRHRANQWRNVDA